jgi:starch synthase
LKVLFVSSEVFPLIKTGGLADVSGSLPFALQGLEVDIRILMPGYTKVLESLSNIQKIADIHSLPLIGHAELLMGTIDETDVPVMVLKAPTLYERDGGPYIDAQGNEWHDNGARFGLLAKVASLIASEHQHLIDWQPDLVHCNDWQTGLTPAYLKLVEHSQTKTVMSLHNMAFQGCFPPSLVSGLELPEEHFVMEGLEYHGQLSFLKAGIFYADRISTVSPKYAEEIQSPEFGFGLDGLLTKRKSEITGILNGIETHEWNPATDKYLCKPYTAQDRSNKDAIKAILQETLSLNIDAQAPLLGIVSRLTHQKGLDLVLPIAQKLIDAGCQIVLLGSGERALENAFTQLAKNNPGKVSVNIGYNEPLSHKIMAGADMFIMPSRFEPCGLNQLYGLAYGTPPVVNPTGGLADSVVDSTNQTIENGTATGFVMTECTSKGLLRAIENALSVYRVAPKAWQTIQANGMGLNLSWDSSAQAYLTMYEGLVKN